MRLIVVLASVCIAAALLLGVTYSLTSGRIQLQEQQAEKAAVLCALPVAEKISAQITDKPIPYYEGYDASGGVIGYAFTGSGKGYSSTIKIMIGVDENMTIQGIKILSQQETPGLGDKVDEVKSTGTLWDLLRGKKIPPAGRPWFQEQFAGKNTETVNEITFITGATITSKAVLDIVKSTIEEFRDQLTGQEPATG